jgi:hypothetical protein
MAAGDAVRPNSDGVAKFFEYIVARRAEHLLDNVSVGPTQQYMKFAFKAACGWPQTWEQLWELYLSNTVTELLNKITYLDPGTCYNGVFPGSPGGDPKSKSVPWLAKHTGGLLLNGERYYEGVGVEPSKAYKNALFIAEQEADNINYNH